LEGFSLMEENTFYTCKPSRIIGAPTRGLDI
jgi:hypothetical protein